MLARHASDRHKAWESGKCADFFSAPITLRYAFNAIFGADGQKVNDFSCSQRSEVLRDLIDLAKRKGFLQLEPAGYLALSEKAAAKIKGSFRSRFVKPPSVDALQVPLGFKKVPDCGFGDKIVELVVEDLQILSRRTPGREDGRSFAAVKLPTTSRDNFIEQVRKEFSEKEDNRNLPIATLKEALAILANPNKEEKAAGRKLLKLLASLADSSPERDGPSRPVVTLAMLRHILPELSAIAFCHSELLQILTVALIPAVETSESASPSKPRERRFMAYQELLQQCQREALPVVGGYLERDRDKLSPENMTKCRQMILHHAHHLQPSSNIATALYWVRQNRTLFSDTELHDATMNVVTYLDRKRLVHELFISTAIDRKTKGVRLAGALEVIIDLVREGRLSKEHGATAYGAVMQYLQLRKRSLSENHCQAQKQEAEKLLETLNILCDGVPKRKLEESGALAQHVVRKRGRPRGSSVATLKKRERERGFLADVMAGLSKAE